MTRKRDRFFALFGAVLFFVTASALTIAIVFSNVSNKNDGTDQQDSASTAQAAGKLQGTKLADFTPVASVPTLQITDTTVGTGDEAKAGDSITADYTGAVAATGIIFQSTKDTGEAVPFSLSGVIEGWSKGIPGMKVGGSRRLLIPAAQGYGANPPAGSGIPPNADLVFDVTLRKVGQ